MHTLVFVVKAILFVVLDFLELAMLIRAIMSWIAPMRGGWFSSVLEAVTEPIIMPFRRLLAKLRWGEGFPLDIAFLLALLMLALIRALLSGV